jgi:hypothetical protein
MKKINLLLILLGILCLLPAQSKAQDTITVELNSKTKIVIYAQDRASLARLRQLDINQIIRDVTAGLDTSTANKESKVKTYEYELNFEEDEMIMISETSSITKTRTRSDTIKRVYKRPRFQQFWGIDLGLNNYLENGSFPDANNQPYALRIGGSRFVSVGAYERMRIGGQKSPFSVQMGLELSWYNFMFENNNYLVRGDEAVEFRDYQDDFSRTLRKNKLTAYYFNIPLTFNARFRDKEGHRTINLGVGGYVGVRLGAHTKIREEGSSDRIRDRDNFFLSNWRYGLEGHLGFNGVLLFFKYDLNSLFVPERGPNLNAIAFGIRL